MNNMTLNKLHRYCGLVLSPFLLLQTLSGLYLGFVVFRRGAGNEGGKSSGFDALLMEIHYGRSWYSDLYHLLLGVGILWMVISGWMLYLRFRRARNRRPSP